jgi:chemotaxis protein methyltransferase CheR
MSELSARDFAYVADLLKAKSGLSLPPAKSYLLESRVLPLLRHYGLRSSTDFVTALRTDEKGTMLTELSEAMATYETFFFRDQKPFDSLQHIVLPKLRLLNQTKKQLRIWCAAASTGQEPYSIAMLFEDSAAQWADWSIEILATDFSATALERAKTGIYSQFEVQRGLPIRLLMKYFTQTGDQWQINPPLKKRIRFAQANLLKPLSHLGSFDVIFCRNVLIYFDAETKTDVLDRLAGVTRPEGCLIMGSAETTLHYSRRFELHPQERTIYVPKSLPLAA